jgi:predicted AlkP superfamily phosphohydrolase/phosphomutase
VGNWVLYPNSWLREAGFVQFRRPGTLKLARILDAVKLRAVTALPSWLQRSLYRLAGKFLGRFEAKVRYGMIDWSETEAYFDENPYFPVLRVNLKGRQPGGIVEPGRHYEDVRNRLIARLEDWRHPETGEKIIHRAYRREEVYSGPCVADAADVIPKWALHGGYSYAYKLSSKAAPGVWIEKVDPHHPDNLRFFTGKSGTHRDDGIFLAHGPAVKPGTIVERARIIDLAPTLLHLMGVQVPGDMDGRVLEDILADDFAEPFLASEHQAAQAIVRKSVAVAATKTADIYSAEDEEKITERLKALGYVE